jgi:hypothetical protein
MSWVNVTPEQVSEAEAWWNARTPMQREAEYPRRVYAGAGFFPCGWRVFGGQERAEVYLVLMKAGVLKGEVLCNQLK